MATAVQLKDDKTVSRARARGGAAKPETGPMPTGRSVDLDARLAEMADAFDADDRRAHFVGTAKETAPLLGAEIYRKMLALTGRTSADVARASGIRKEELSKLCNGKTGTGPQLFTLLAIADALGLELDVTPRLR